MLDRLELRRMDEEQRRSEREFQRAIEERRLRFEADQEARQAKREQERDDEMRARARIVVTNAWWRSRRSSTTGS